MRPITKGEAPECLLKWIEEQCNARQTTDYYAFDQGKKLKEHLLDEQFGLCAYTGRLVVASQVSVEHIKPYSKCRNEKAANGLMVGEDVDHMNMVATHRTYAPNEYGEALRGNWFNANYISPLEHDCGTHFSFELDGNIASNTLRGQAMIAKLRLDHPKLVEERRAAIDSAVDDLANSLDELGSISNFIAHTLIPVGRQLPTFVFVLESALLKLE